MTDDRDAPPPTGSGSDLPNDDARPVDASAPEPTSSTGDRDGAGGANSVESAADEPPPADASRDDTPPADASRDDTPREDVGRGRRGRRKARKPRRKAPWWELPALVILAVGIAILVKSFVVQPFYIPSESMERTLHGCPGCRGDRILVNKPVYSLIRDPEPGDIVVFDAPSGWDNEPASVPPSNPVVRVVRGFGQLVGFVPPDGQVLVKRVIAVGGQTVKGDAEGHVMISNTGPNGNFRTLDEPYVYAPAVESGNQVPFGPVTVPKGRLWVMGDHRTDSADSRFHCTPGGPEGTANDSNCNPTSSTVPDSLVIGKAFVIAWPPSRWRTLGTPSTFTSAASAVGPALPSALAAATVVAGLRRPPAPALPLTCHDRIAAFRLPHVPPAPGRRPS